MMQWRQLVDDTDVSGALALLTHASPGIRIEERALRGHDDRGWTFHMTSSDLREVARGMVKIADWLDVRAIAKEVKELDMNTEKRTSDEWLTHADYEGIEVLDPDGWDRQNFEASWAEPITQEEFTDRLCRSTCKLPSTFEMKKT